MEGLIHRKKVDSIKNFVGIDPGMRGGIAVIGDSGKIVDTIPMPIRKDKLIDHDSIYRYIKDIASPTIFVERSVAFGMGVTSAFNYGRGFAAIEIAIELSGNQINYVYPQTWTRFLHQGISRDIDPKSRSLIKARSLFGDKALPKSPRGKPHDGIVDALLIAEYGRQWNNLN